MIPKDIYICHKNLDDIEQYSNKWKLLNPDMNVHLYDDNLCIQFLLENFPPIYANIFNFIKDGPIKSDFWRLCILYINGRCYVDADIEPFVPLSRYITFDEYFVTCLSCFNNSYNPHFIMCEKHNKIIGKCIDQYIHFYLSRKIYSYNNWSIVHIFNNILKFKINNNISGEYIINGKKLKFLKEEQINTNGRQYCNYKGHIVLSNRYENYKNHRFMTDEEIKQLENIRRYKSLPNRLSMDDIKNLSNINKNISFRMIK